MINWLVGVLTSPFRVLADLADAILSGLKALWHGLTALGRGVRTAWNWMVAGAKAIGGILERVALDVYNGLRWLIAVQLPKWAAWALKQALKGATIVVNAVKSFATNLYHLALAFAQKIVNTLAAWAHDAVSFLTRTLADAWNLLRKVAAIVGDLLTHPDRLAAWVFDAIWKLFWKAFRAVVTPVARFLFSHMLAMALEGVHLVESIVSDLLGS